MTGDQRHPLADTLVAYPPGRATLWLPRRPRWAAAAGVGLYAACRPSRIVAHYAAWLGIRVVGPRLLRGGPIDVASPDVLATLCGDWHAHIGPFDAVAVYAHPASLDERFAMLLMHDHRSVAFVKVRPEHDEGLIRERTALDLVAGGRLGLFSSPTVLAHGQVAGRVWLATTPLPGRPHRPAPARVVPAVAAALRDALADLPRPPSCPSDWVPMHGDLSPWNLRRAAGTTWLYDWEDARWGPTGADAWYFALAAAIIHGRRFDSPDTRLANYWADRVAGRRDVTTPGTFNNALAARLGKLGGRGTTA